MGPVSISSAGSGGVAVTATTIPGRPDKIPAPRPVGFRHRRIRHRCSVPIWALAAIGSPSRPRSGRIGSVSEIESADERAILDQLRKAQDAHHRGDQATANTLLDDLLTRF